MPTGVDAFIIDAESGDRIQFKYYEDVESSVEPIYDESVVRGRSEEHLFYSHTGAETLSFQLKFAASVDQADGGNAKKIWNDHLFVKSFAYPSYGIDQKGPVLPPRKAIIVIGNWLTKVGVIRSPSFTFSKACDEDGYPLFIDVRFTLRVVNKVPLDLFDIRQLRMIEE